MGFNALIDLFNQHRVAGNLLMVMMIVFGIYGLSKLNRQILPDFTLGIISIAVEWPGASPEDVEANILEPIEPEIQFLDKVRRVESIAYEGRADIKITFKDNADISKALTDVQAAIARIAILPVDSEKPVITQVIPTDRVCRLQISGPFSEQALKITANRIRDDLLERGLTKVAIEGARESEIWVEVADDVLRQLDLTVNDIADKIETDSLDLPSGSITSGEVTRQIRTESLARSANAVAEIDVLSAQSGERLQLKDIAKISETFKENSVSNVIDGNTSIGLVVYRARGFDSIIAQQLVLEYLEELRPQLPPTLKISIYQIVADRVTQRVKTLVNNGFFGFLLVLGMLFFFLNGRVAFWVAMGIPVSIMAALGGMALIGMSLNLISMFAIIMGLGIVVDDAIVVGEHTEHLHRRGLPADVASLHAARTMLTPVMAAIFTTIAAFAPLLAIGSQIGMILRDMPLVIIMLLAASAIECFLVLPMHLKHSLKKMDDAPAKEPSRFYVAFDHFRDNGFTSIVEFCFRRRYTTVIAMVAVFSFALSMLMTGRVSFEFFSSNETDIVYANFALSPGSRRERTAEMVEEMARAARAAEARLTDQAGGLIVFENGTIGSGHARTGEAAVIGDHTGSYLIELQPGDLRSIRTTEFMEAWEEELQPVPAVEQLTIFEETLTPGRDLDIRVHSAPLRVIKAAAIEIRERLDSIPGTLAVEDNLPYGKQEILLRLSSAGRAMGFTNQDVSRQVRNSFEGAIAKRFSRDQEEIIVRVKLLESDNRPNTIRDLYVRAPDGAEVPLTEVVDLEYRVGFSQISREDGLRQASVTGNVDGSITTSNEIMATVERTIAPEIREKYGVAIEFKGKAEEQAEAFADMQIVGTLALTAMFVILAYVFQSYTTPLLIIVIVPFGFIGAIFGHYIMGFNMTMMSTQAFLGLAGVLVNDAILLVATIKRSAAGGVALKDAVLSGARERLRPIVLTTLTTVAGLAPLLFETSLDARLVQPLAVTLVFGMLFSPFLIMCFIPALLSIGSDLGLRRGGIPMHMTAGPAMVSSAGTMES
jgi:multidrug efflux pump subunit AcrB